MKEPEAVCVNKTELSKLPYLTHIPNDGRIVPIETYFDHAEGRWLTWIVSDGKLQEMRGLDLCSSDRKLLKVRDLGLRQGMYVSSSPESPDRDHHMPFAEIVLKHFCTSDISYQMNQASQDLVNCLGYIEKYFILLHHAQQFKCRNTNALVQIELEGIFGVHRSYYDLLQRIVNEIHHRYATQEISIPQSFRKVAQKKPEELVNKYHFPDPLVQFYQEKKPLFLACRQIRDDVFHSGHSLDVAYTLDDGFAIRVDEKPWTTLAPLVHLWSGDKLRNNRLGCVLAVFALLTEDMFKTMSRLGEAILASFQKPPTACFKDHVYLRTPLARHLHRLDEYKQQQWITPQRALPEMAEGLLHSSPSCSSKAVDGLLRNAEE